MNVIKVLIYMVPLVAPEQQGSLIYAYIYLMY